MVKDIVPGPGSSISGGGTSIVNANGTVFFVASDLTHGEELWKSDGTSAGTVMVKDIRPGSLRSRIWGGNLTSMKGTAYFLANDGTSGYELWKSDGTPEGTAVVKDIRPGPDSSTSWYGYMKNINETLFFDASDGTIGGRGLWKSDGTASGTVMVKALSELEDKNITNVNGVLFFEASESVGEDTSLWKSDGTTAGTQMVNDINPSADDRFFDLMNGDGVLYFPANDGTHGWELWKSDGTPTGTALVKDIWTGSGHGTEGWSYLAYVNGVVLFAAEQDDGSGVELWKSDGTTAGTLLLRDLNGGSNSPDPVYITNVNGNAFFALTTVLSAPNYGCRMGQQQAQSTCEISVRELQGLNRSTSRM